MDACFRFVGAKSDTVIITAPYGRNSDSYADLAIFEQEKEIIRIMLPVKKWEEIVEDYLRIKKDNEQYGYYD